LVDLGARAPLGAEPNQHREGQNPGHDSHRRSKADAYTSDDAARAVSDHDCVTAGTHGYK